MLSREFIHKYEKELAVLYGAKIKYPLSWRNLNCSDTVKIIGTFLFQSNDKELDEFKKMIQDPITYIHPGHLEIDYTKVSITAKHISIKLFLKINELPNFEKFGMNNPDCLYPGKYVNDEKERTKNYVNWLIEKLMVPEYMNKVELRVEKISFF